MINNIDDFINNYNKNQTLLFTNDLITVIDL